MQKRGGKSTMHHSSQQGNQPWEGSSSDLGESTEKANVSCLLENENHKNCNRNWCNFFLGEKI